MSAQPISDGELVELFACLEGRDRVALAVSGGADSLALMHLVARWRGLKGPTAPKPIVLTVDHGLRRASAAEADYVAQQACGLGFEHRLLRWEGEKPRSNLQAAARAARYDLMADHCHVAGITALVTAHHLEDQAETVLMRLGRGSGVDGLSAMAEAGSWAGIDLLRPLLDLGKVRLTATLKAAGVDWIDDPSNRNERFERVRVRRALGRLEALGITPDRLALTARRMRRARVALDAAASELLERAVELGPAGDCRIARDALLGAPDEIALRALVRMLIAAGGGAVLPRLAKVERLLTLLKDDEDRSRTLSGCRIEAMGSMIAIFRESGRDGLPEMRLAPGSSGVWDRRFLVRAPRALSGPVDVRALTREGYAHVRALSGMPIDLPSRVAGTLAAFWRQDEVLAVPSLGYHAGLIGAEDAESVVARDCSATFVNARILGDNSDPSSLIRSS